MTLQDIGFAANQIVVRDGKGRKDRVTTLPESVKAPLQEHLKWAYPQFMSSGKEPQEFAGGSTGGLAGERWRVFRGILYPDTLSRLTSSFAAGKFHNSPFTPTSCSLEGCPMAVPQGNADGSQAGSAGEEDIYAIREPVRRSPLPVDVERLMQKAVEPRITTAESPPPPPKWPMLSGVFTFPWYTQTVGYWAVMSMGLAITFLMFVVMWGATGVLGMVAVRAFGIPAAGLFAMTMAYASSCCLKVVEETAHGWDSFDIEVGADWKEWMWDYTYMLFLFSQAAVVGLVVWLFTSSLLASVVTTLVVFPVFLLSALTAGSTWLPMALGQVLRTMGSRWRQWCFFYLAVAAIAVGWAAVTNAVLFESPWLAPFVSGPLLATAMLIGARLLGRLALCIGEDILRQEEINRKDGDR